MPRTSKKLASGIWEGVCGPKGPRAGRSAHSVNCKPQQAGPPEDGCSRGGAGVTEEEPGEGRSPGKPLWGVLTWRAFPQYPGKSPARARPCREGHLRSSPPATDGQRVTQRGPRLLQTQHSNTVLVIKGRRDRRSALVLEADAAGRHTGARELQAPEDYYRCLPGQWGKGLLLDMSNLTYSSLNAGSRRLQ